MSRRDILTPLRSTSLTVSDGGPTPTSTHCVAGVERQISLLASNRLGRQPVGEFGDGVNREQRMLGEAVADGIDRRANASANSAASMSTMLVAAEMSIHRYVRASAARNYQRMSIFRRIPPRASGAPRPTGEQLAVELGAQLRGMLPGEVRLRVPQYGASHLRPVIEMPQDRVRKGARVAGLEDERRVTGELWQRA